MNNEIKNTNEIFDQNPEKEKIEIELKFKPVDPHFFDFFKQAYEGKYINQVYLSHGGQDFSVRARSTTENGHTTYSAAIKDNGEVVRTGLARLETPTAIDQAAFEQYASSDEYASLKKLRVEPAAGVSIDFIEGWPHPIIEIEDIEINEEAQQFLQMYEDQLVDHSGEVEMNNEYIAHAVSGMKYETESQLDLSAEKVVDEIMAYKSIGYKNVVVSISGRSGSGKTTLAKQVQTLLAYREHLGAAFLSTDDYHVGKTFLENNYESPWRNWDSPLVYDTQALNDDIKKLLSGESVPKRAFSFETQEPYTEGYVHSHEVIIVEGIQSGSSDLQEVRTVHFELETPFEKCIARDISRLRDGSRPNSTIGSPEQRLRYQLEYAEPAYLSKEKPPRNSWSASVRPLGAVALNNER